MLGRIAEPNKYYTPEGVALADNAQTLATYNTLEKEQQKQLIVHRA